MPCPSITGTRNCISINQTALIQPHNQRCPPTIVERRGTILWFACQPFIHGHEPRRSPCITSRPEEQKSSGVRLDKLLPIRINLCGRYRRGGGPVKPVGAPGVRRAVPRKSGDVPTMWCGRVQHVASGQPATFTSRRALLAFLASQLHAQPDAGDVATGKRN